MVNMFKVRCFKQIYANLAAVSSEDVWLYRDIELPFPPFIGLLIVDNNWECSIQGISYNAHKGLFYAITDPNKEIYYAKFNRQSHRPIEKIVAEYMKAGWGKEM